MEKQIAVSTLASLAHETRLDVFRILVQAAPKGLAAGVIGTVLEIPSATLSFHLKELKSAGLIQCRRQGSSRIYRTDLFAVNQLIAFLTANCCQGLDGALGADEEDTLESRAGYSTTLPTDKIQKETR